VKRNVTVPEGRSLRIGLDLSELSLVEPLLDTRQGHLLPLYIVEGSVVSNLVTRIRGFTVEATKPAGCQDLSERMMELEPTTFCMAST
jgi:hypothetical protein